MIDVGLKDGELIVFQTPIASSPSENELALIERIDDGDGGALAVKKFVKSDVETVSIDDWESPVISLKSHNKQFPKFRLDPNGRYQYRGKFLRKYESWEFEVLDAEDVEIAAENGVPNRSW